MVEEEIKRINEKLDCMFAEFNKKKLSELDSKAIHDIRYIVRQMKYDNDMKNINEKIEKNIKQRKDLDQDLMYLYKEKETIERNYYNGN